MATKFGRLFGEQNAIKILMSESQIIKMDKEDIKIIVGSVLENIITKKKFPEVPVGVSNRHIHISEKDKDILFGKGYNLTKKTALKQPGQFACNETLTIVGNRGSISNVRILGPVRKFTQIEISRTDSFVIGVEACLRNSGDLKKTGSGFLIGPEGSLYKEEGFIVSTNHLHLSEKEAEGMGLKDKDYVTVRCLNIRKVYFSGVLVRAGNKHSMEFHVDTDEANSAFLNNGDMVEILI